MKEWIKNHRFIVTLIIAIIIVTILMLSIIYIPLEYIFIGSMMITLVIALTLIIYDVLGTK